MSPLDRRQFVTRSLVALGTAGLGGAIAGAADASDPAPSNTGAPVAQDGLLERVPFDGIRQAGILAPPARQSTFAALDAVAGDAGTLRTALAALSGRARQLASGGPSPLSEVDAPTVDSGTLGPVIAPDGLTVTIAFGASLFDDRYGFAAKRPSALTAMPVFANDKIDPAQAHGDVLLSIGAGHRDTVVHALRELLRVTRGALQLRWMVDGFQSADRGPTAKSSSRNLFSFRDGTANPDPDDAALMDRLVWVPRSASGPAWTAGGTYQVVRRIRMHVEFWDRVGLREQENMIGRSRDSGAPLGGTREFQDPRLDLDPKGERIPLDAHIRLANPRTAKTDDQRILRRGHNYTQGFDAAGTLDQGLVFVAFNQDPERQFATIQRRLDDEPMVDYITPVGGGYFFAPRGTGGSQNFVGQDLFLPA